MAANSDTDKFAIPVVQGGTPHRDLKTPLGKKFTIKTKK